MTRDSSRIFDDRESVGPIIFTELWALAPSTRLPEDAPTELKKLAIDIYDPRRVYAIHKASRRHYFELLLEKFIHQIRYGCNNKLCSTPTCFSCRKRLANGGPVRRFNATSARTLAFHMISLDNPEKGLCPHPGVAILDDKSKTSRYKVASLRDMPRSSLINESRPSDVKSVSQEKPFEKPNRVVTTEKSYGEKFQSKHGILEEPTTTDHRSFIQNMFETVAIKMVEWLTPKNFESLVAEREDAEVRSNRDQGDEDKNNINGTNMSSTYLKTTQVQDEKLPQHNRKPAQVMVPSNQSELLSIPEDVSDLTVRPIQNHSTVDLEERLSEVLSFQQKNEEKIGVDYVERCAPSQHQRIDKRPSGELPMQISLKITDVVDGSSDTIPNLTNQSLKSSELNSIHKEVESNKNSSPDDYQDLAKVPNQKTEVKQEYKYSKLPPQSLRTLTIETIEFMCNTLQTDGTCEEHFLHPSRIGKELFKKRSIPQNRKMMHRQNMPEKGLVYSNSAKQQWKIFIEQCFFDVLKKHRSLLSTFSDGQKKLFDSQTIWYLMLRMTRVSPALVFDSLWNVAETLFRPSRKLEAVYDWVEDCSSQQSVLTRSISNQDAADIVNICLHALIAAAPLVDNATKLSDLSKIRSLGMTMSAKESTCPEMITLCLQYEDAFTNDLAIRLARRIFMAIPTRRKFSESLEAHKIYDDEKQEPDILYSILNTINTLSSRSPLTLEFSNSERDLHEIRVPILVLDWARAVMLQDWKGSAEVPSDGPFGGALATIAAIYENRQSLLLSDIHFHTEYFADRLDSISMPIEWLSFNPNKKTVHLLDYPYLFSPATLISYFRAINYSKMSLAHEAAKCEYSRLSFTTQDHDLPIDEHSYTKLHERLRIATSKFMVMQIRRSHVLLDTFNSIWRREERELMRPLKLRLGEEGGEEGSDSGGVQQEYLRLAIAEALNPDYGTFTVDPRTKMTWFQPGSPEPLWKYELIGIIMSLAVYNGLTLPVTFPKVFYKKLLGDKVIELHHISDGWPDLVNGLTSLLEWDEKNGLVEDVFTRTYEFTVEQFGLPISVEMKDEDAKSPTWPQFSFLFQSTALNPTGAPLVTGANRKQYVKDYIRYLTDISIRPQFSAFKEGFFTCFSRRSVSLFDAPTLQSLVEGVQMIDVSELRHITRYVGWEDDANHRTIKEFWSVVTNYDLDMRRKLLEFVTASDRVPVGGIGGIQFTIQKNGCDDGFLPTSYTCYGILLLPEYSSKFILEKRLAMALENSKGFGFA